MVWIGCLLTSVLLLPIAFHELIVSNTTEKTIIRLGVYDKTHPFSDFTFYIDTLPNFGELHHQYRDYRDEIPSRTNITLSHTALSDNNVNYKRTVSLVSFTRDVFTYISINKKNGYVSTVGRITIVPSNGIISISDFTIDNDGWTIIGNKEKSSDAFISRTSAGPLLSHYIYGSDNIINHNRYSSDDVNLWYFNAPAKFTGNKGIAYGGYIEFDITSFSGDFTKKHNNYMVILECNICDNNNGIRLGISSANIVFDGKSRKISIMLIEDMGWVNIDSNEMLLKCHFVSVLSNLSSMKILGDWTSWYETIGIDNVIIRNERSMKVPICRCPY